MLQLQVPLHLITLFAKGLGFYPVICSSNIQLKLQVENHLHIVDHGFTSFCTTLLFVHISSMKLLLF